MMIISFKIFSSLSAHSSSFFFVDLHSFGTKFASFFIFCTIAILVYSSLGWHVEHERAALFGIECWLLASFGCFSFLLYIIAGQLLYSINDE